MYRNASTVYDTERAQAGVRMIFMSVAACYIVILYHLALIDPALGLRNKIALGPSAALLFCNYGQGGLRAAP